MKDTHKTRKGAYDKRFVRALEKAFIVLEAMSQERKSGMALEEISRSGGIHKATAHRLLYTLSKLGYVSQDADTEMYSLSGKFFELGKNALPYQRLTAIAKPLMRRLLLTFGESVNLAVPHDGSLVYIQVLESPKSFRMAAYVGQSALMHCTSVGKCIAAFMSQKEREEYVARHGLPPVTPSTITSPQQFEADLEQVRKEGIALDNEEGAQGIICVGGPIFANASEPIAALSISGPSIRMTQNLPAMKAAVKEAIQTLSMLLGSPRNTN